MNTSIAHGVGSSDQYSPLAPEWDIWRHATEKVSTNAGEQKNSITDMAVKGALVMTTFLLYGSLFVWLYRGLEHYRVF